MHGCRHLHRAPPDEVHFVSLGDAFEVSPDQLKRGGLTQKFQQLRIILTGLRARRQLLELLKSKPNQRNLWCGDPNASLPTMRRKNPDQEEVEQESVAQLPTKPAVN